MSQDQPAWTFEHSVNCHVSAEFAWAFWTNVSNWALDADVESIEMEGPFGAGAHGITNSKSSGRIEWRIAEVQPGAAVIEFPLPRAAGRFAWTFVASGGGVTITQRCTLEGPHASNLRQSDWTKFGVWYPGGNEQIM